MRQCIDSDNLHRRLKKIIGQVQAIDRMIDEDVPCEDILSQLNAANQLCTNAAKLSWRDTSSTASATVSSTETPIKPSKISPKPSKDFLT